MEFWVLDTNAIQRCISLNKPESKLFLCDILDILARETGFDKDTMIFFFQGKRTYSFNPNLTSYNSYLQIYEICGPQKLLARFHYPQQDRSFSVVAEENLGIMFDLLLELRLKYREKNLFKKEFQLSSQHNGLISLRYPLENFRSEEEFKIEEPLAPTIRIIAKLLCNKEEDFEVRPEMNIADLHCLIALYSGFHFKKILISNRRKKVMTEGTLDSNGIEEDDVIFVSEAHKDKHPKSFNSLPNLRKGLSWIVKCSNINCKKRKTDLLVNSHYGIFDLHREPTRLKCPECSQNLPTPKSFLFFECNFKLSGKKPTESTLTTESHLITSEPLEFSYTDWEYLLIICTKHYITTNIN